MANGGTFDVAIIYFSGFGHTEKVAHLVKEGLEESPDVSVRLLKADEIAGDLSVLDDADALVFGSPTYMGGPAASWKQFADASSELWFEMRWRDKLAAGFTNASGLSGDQLSTLQYFVTLAMQHGMVWVGLGELPPMAKEGHGADPGDVNRLSSFTGLMTQSDNADPAKTPAPGDVETAKIFGRRVASAVRRWGKSGSGGG